MSDKEKDNVNDNDNESKDKNTQEIIKEFEEYVEGKNSYQIRKLKKAIISGRIWTKLAIGIEVIWLISFVGQLLYFLDYIPFQLFQWQTEGISQFQGLILTLLLVIWLGLITTSITIKTYLYELKLAIIENQGDDNEEI